MDYLERIKTLQGRFNTSEYARFLEVPQPTLNYLLKGERKLSVELLCRICNKHKVSADYILGLSDESQNRVVQSTVNGHNVNGSGNVVSSAPADAEEISRLKTENAALKIKLEYATELIKNLKK